MLTCPDEEWRDIPGFDGMYQASTEGRIRSTKSKTQWSRWKNYKGAALKQNGWRYKQVSLQTADGESNFHVHALVALAFLGPRPDDMQVCHGDGDRHNNRPANLRHDTIPENHADKCEHGTQAVGPKHHRAKYTAEQEAQIVAASGNDSEVARRFGICRRTVAVIRKRHRGIYEL